MKTLFNIVGVVAKVITILFSIIGAILMARMVILAKPAINHVYDVVEETNDLNPDDEDQDNRLMSEAYRRTYSDPCIKNNKFVNAVDRGVAKFVSFVANL